MLGKKSVIFSTLHNFIGEEHIVTKIIWDIIFREILEIAEIKRHHKHVMFSILVNSHCCGCGKLIGFTRKNKKYGFNFQMWDRNGYFHGKYCKKSCWRFIDDLLLDEGRYPLYHQNFGSEHNDNFFLKLNTTYSDVGLIDLTLKSVEL